MTLQAVQKDTWLKDLPGATVSPSPLQCAVGVMAYNEAANVARCLNSLLNQRTRLACITEIVVVVSGCTDNTAAIVEGFCQRDARVRLVCQKRREGKASAINLYLSRSRAPILVMVGADNLLPPDSLEELVLPLLDPEIGMTGGHPIPLNNPSSFMGFAAHTLWNLLHLIASQSPKLGELTAFRRIFERIPYDSAVDEANIEPLVRGQGYEIRYVPQAIVHNRGPNTIRDFLRQRRRINAGHYRLRQKQGYSVATLNGLRILLTLLRHPQWHWRWFVWTPAVVALEVWGRLLGYWDCHYAKRTHTVWDVAVTTKELG